MHLAMKKGTKIFHYTSNSWGISSEFTFSLDKNPNDGYEGPSVHKFFLKIEKKWNLQIPWGLEDFTLPSVGQGSKHGSVVHPTPQNECNLHCDYLDITLKFWLFNWKFAFSTALVLWSKTKNSSSLILLNLNLRVEPCMVNLI
jgi:hypothetical protein